VGKDSPLLIELLGQPGAGKTTLAHAAAADLNLLGTADLSAGWRNLPFPRKASLAAQVILDGAGLGQALRVVTRESLFHPDSIARLGRLLAKSHWIRAQGGRLLLEEGALQDLWSIYYSAGRTRPDPHLLAPLVRSLYQGVEAQIILLEVDPQIAFDRVRGRRAGKSRLDRLAAPDLRRTIAETAQLHIGLAEAARLAGLPVKSIDASQPLERSVLELRDIIDGI
jgi:hypothetical protein